LEFFEVVKKRRSIHYFIDEEISDEDLNYILETARWALSARNSQPWRFIIVRESENIHKIWESTTGIQFPISSKRSIPINPPNFIKRAPVIIVVCTDPTAYKGRQASINASLSCIQDSAIAAMNLLLAVCDRGLGACWVGMFRE
jgi:nitroreductase